MGQWVTGNDPWPMTHGPISISELAIHISGCYCVVCTYARPVPARVSSQRKHNIMQFCCQLIGVWTTVGLRNVWTCWAEQRPPANFRVPTRMPKNYEVKVAYYSKQIRKTNISEQTNRKCALLHTKIDAEIVWQNWMENAHKFFRTGRPTLIIRPGVHMPIGVV